MLDYDGALDLLKAISTQWAKDARKNPDELPGLADWLEMEQHEARRFPSIPPVREARAASGYTVAIGAGCDTRRNPKRSGE